MAPGTLRVLALVTDAYGGTGGIAQYCRDFLESVASHESVSEIVVVPRVIARDMQELPDRVTHLHEVAGSKQRFVRAVTRLSSPGEKFGLVICSPSDRRYGEDHGLHVSSAAGVLPERV